MSLSGEYYQVGSPWFAKQMISASDNISKCLEVIDNLCDELSRSQDPIREVENWYNVVDIRNAVDELTNIEKDIKNKKSAILQKAGSNVDKAKSKDDKHWKAVNSLRGRYYGSNYVQLRNDYPPKMSGYAQEYIDRREERKRQYYNAD